MRNIPEVRVRCANRSNNQVIRSLYEMRTHVRMTTQVYLPTGVPNLDDIMKGGIPRGSLTLIIGVPGSGKTTLASQIAFASAHAGRTVLILTALSESTNKLLEHLRDFAFF